MNETVNQDQTTVTQSENKTFTQEEVNSIVADRLQRERGKYADYDSLKEKATKLDELEEASKTDYSSRKGNYNQCNYIGPCCCMGWRNRKCSCI